MKLSSPPIGLGQSCARYVFASARASLVGVIVIFVPFAAGAAACFSPPPHAATSTAAVRARSPGTLERCQIMERNSLMGSGLGYGDRPPGTILHPKPAREKEARGWRTA